MARLTGGQALVQSLAREGLETLFGLPGVQLDWAYDALYEERDRIAVCHTRHEQATAYMADGYARTTGRIGACMVVPGPGLLNASAALATAYACSSPVLCVAGQIPAATIDKRYGMLHEIHNQRAVMASVTKWVGRADTPAEVPGVVREAFRQLRTGRPHPVGIEVPADMLQMTEDVTLLDPAPAERSAGDPDLLRQAAALLHAAERPLIYSGGGVLSAGAWDELRAVAELLEAPVVMSLDGRGALSDRHDLAQTGLSGMHLLPDADVVLAVGTRFFQPAIAWGLPPGARVIRIEIDPDEIARFGQPTVGIVGDAKSALAALRDLLDGTKPRPSRAAEWRAAKEAANAQLAAIEPQAAYCTAIRAAMPDDGILVTDLTQVSFYATLGFPVYAPRTLIGPGYQGTLGSGFATALGAQVGNPGTKVVALLGDGGFLYTMQELATMRQQRLNVVAIVFNDNAYGNVKRVQQQQFSGHLIAADLVNPDFLALARSFGIDGVRVHTPDGLRSMEPEQHRVRRPAKVWLHARWVSLVPALILIFFVASAAISPRSTQAVNDSADPVTSPVLPTPLPPSATPNGTEAIAALPVSFTTGGLTSMNDVAEPTATSLPVPTDTPTPPPATATAVPPTPTPSGPTPTPDQGAAGKAQPVNGTIRVPVLMYHYIRVNPVATDRLGFGLSVTPTDFAAQMDWLVKNGYHAIFPSELTAAMIQGAPLPTKPIVLTFDDGYRDFYEQAWPVLKQHGLKSASAVVTSFADKGDRGDRLFMDWRMIRELDQSGMVEIASHTQTHPDLPRLSTTARWAELSQSKAQIEQQLGHPCTTFVYPSGRYDGATLVDAKRAGYQIAFTTNGGKVRAPQDTDAILQLPRVRVAGGTTLAGFAENLG
ncbi:MAG: polysaccharide deacetylase family protein [Thermomicrobia bacterium]|nr:polysaccharide deacetylase family protein [Thermomicrobia bacterium]